MTDIEFRDAYQRHKDVLYRFARRMTGSSTEAEDIVQDSFLELWRNASQFDPSRGTLRSFLIGVTRNLIRRRLRSDRLAGELEDDSAHCGPIDIEGLERGEMIARAVAALPPLQREALILAEYEEMLLEEIGYATHANLAAVKSRLHRARENLRRMLAPLLETKGAVHGTNERSSTE
ncbi:MAG: RNA polymerase sigma factor [Acidobacteriota bacterium]